MATRNAKPSLNGGRHHHHHHRRHHHQCLLFLAVCVLSLSRGSGATETLLPSHSASTSASATVSAAAAAVTTSTTESPLIINSQAVEAATAEALKSLESLGGSNEEKTIIVAITSDNSTTILNPKTTTTTTTTTTTPSPVTKTIVVKESADGSVVSIVSHHLNNNNHKHSSKTISTSDKLHKFDLFIDPVCEQLVKLTEKQLNKVYQQLKQFSAHTRDDHLAKCFTGHGFHFDRSQLNVMNRDHMSELCSARSTNSEAYKQFSICAARDWPSAIDKEIDVILKNRIKGGGSGNKGSSHSSSKSKAETDGGAGSLSSAERSLIDDIVAHLHEEQVQEIASELTQEQKHSTEASSSSTTSTSTSTSTTTTSTTTSAPSTHKASVAAVAAAAVATLATSGASSSSSSTHQQPMGKLNQSENKSAELALGSAETSSSSSSLHHHHNKQQPDATLTVSATTATATTTATAPSSPHQTPTAAPEPAPPGHLSSAAVAAAAATGVSGPPSGAPHLPPGPEVIPSTLNEFSHAPIPVSSGLGDSINGNQHELSHAQQVLPTTHSPLLPVAHDQASVLSVNHHETTTTTTSSSSSSNILATPQQQLPLLQPPTDFMGLPIMNANSNDIVSNQAASATAAAGNLNASAGAAATTAAGHLTQTGPSQNVATATAAASPPVVPIVGDRFIPHESSPLLGLPAQQQVPMPMASSPSTIPPIGHLNIQALPKLEEAIKLLSPVDAAAGATLRSTTPAPFIAGIQGNPTISPLANLLLNSIDFVTSRRPTEATTTIHHDHLASPNASTAATSAAAAAASGSRSGLLPLDQSGSEPPAPAVLPEAIPTSTSGPQSIPAPLQPSAPLLPLPPLQPIGVTAPPNDAQGFIPAPPLASLDHHPEPTIAPPAVDHHAAAHPTLVPALLHPVAGLPEVAPLPAPTASPAASTAATVATVEKPGSAKIEPAVWSSVNSALEILAHPNSMPNGTLTIMSQPKAGNDPSSSSTTTTTFIVTSDPKSSTTTPKPSALIKTETSKLTDLLTGTTSKPEVKVSLVGSTTTPAPIATKKLPGLASIESVNHTVEVETLGGTKKSISHKASQDVGKTDKSYVHEIIVIGDHVEGDDLMHDYDDHSEHLDEHEDHGDNHDHHDHHGNDDEIQIEHKVVKSTKKHTRKGSGKKALSLEEELEEKKRKAEGHHEGGGSGSSSSSSSSSGSSSSDDDHSDHEHLLAGLLAGDVIHVDAGELDKSSD